MEQLIDGEPEEEYESIPWESILRDGRDDRRNRLLLGAGLLAVAVVVGLGSRVVFPPAGPEVVEIAASEAPATVPVPTSAVASATTEPPSEADLMAVLPPDLAVAAATTAQWFLADYFTLDGTDRRLDRWDGLPALEAPDPSWRSTVRSVEAVDTRMAAADRFLVAVRVVRSVAAEPDAAPIDATDVYEVLVGVDADGLRVLDLPRPVRTTAPTSQTVPAAVLEGAVASVDAPVAGPPLAAERRGDRWRIVLGVEDDAGVVWPVVVWVDDGGDPVPTARAGSAEVAL